MICRLLIAAIVFFLICCIYDVEGCHTWGGHTPINRKKRATAQEYADTIGLRKYFTDCMNDKAGNVPGWKDNVDFTILDSIWFKNTEDVDCLADNRADCWIELLGSYVQTPSVLAAGRACVAQYEIDWSNGKSTYTPTNGRKKRQISTSREIPVNPETFFPGNQDSRRLFEYSFCLINSVPRRGERNPLNYALVSSFVSNHLRDSCGSGRRRGFNSARSVTWPYKFIALTRTDSALRDPLQNCGTQTYPPPPFWSAYDPWSDCSSSCGRGTQIRTRTCRDSANPRKSARGCRGNKRETRSCTGNKSCEVPSWESWSSWTRCVSRSFFGACSSGTQSRARRCLRNERQQIASKFCDGLDTETRSCLPVCQRFPL